MNKLPSYSLKNDNGFEYEKIDLKNSPDYIEIDFNAHLLSMTKFIVYWWWRSRYFFWQQVYNFYVEGNSLADDCTLVDAYFVEHCDLQSYIKRREENYALISSNLIDKSYEVCCSFVAFEYGQAVMYCQRLHVQWHFCFIWILFFVDQFDLDSILRNIWFFSWQLFCPQTFLWLFLCVCIFAQHFH